MACSHDWSCDYHMILYFVGFESLLEASRYRELSLLFKLFTRFREGLSLICKAFSEYIKVSGVLAANIDQIKDVA